MTICARGLTGRSTMNVRRRASQPCSSIVTTVMVVLATTIVLIDTSGAHAELAFFRMIYDEAKYDQDRSRYEVVAPSTASGVEQTRYVERRAAISISYEDIASIVGRVKYKYDERDRPVEQYYLITFYFNDSARATIKDFFGANENERFELRIGTEHLNFVFVRGPFGAGDQVSTAMVGRSKKAIEQLLSPIKRGVQWR